MNRLRSDCMRCLIKNAVDIPESASESDKLQYMQQVLKILANAPLTASAPEIVWEINKLKHTVLGLQNEFSELKQHFNAVILSYLPELRKRVQQAPDELMAAIQYSLVCNYIDFGAMEHVDETYLSTLLDEALNIQLDPVLYQRLQANLSSAKHLLFLTDNCGEIVADKLLIEVIRRHYPQLSITAMVRGEPVLNDATMEDAQQVGLTKLIHVIDNGNGIAGTCLEQLSTTAKFAVENADLILSKGQGNFETLRKCGLNIYYLFLCKCDMFAREFKVSKLTGILTHDSCCTEI